MARIRSVHPGLWTDEAFVSVTPLARLLFIGVWTEADDLGCFEWKPVTLKMRVLPIDNVDTAALLAELRAANMVMSYSANGKEYGAIRNFCRFQRPKKPKSIHPITDEVRLFVGSTGDSSELDDDEGGSGSSSKQAQPPPVPKKAELALVKTERVPTIPEKSPQMEDEGDKREDEGSVEDSRSLRSLVRSQPRSRAAKADAGFAEFYAAYPRKQQPDDGLKAWRQVLAQGVESTEIMAGLARHEFTDEPKFIPLPASWLRAGAWKDEPLAAVQRAATPRENPAFRRIRETEEAMHRMTYPELYADDGVTIEHVPEQGRFLQ